MTAESAITLVSFWLYLSIAIAACSRPQLKLLPVSLPDLSRVDEAVKAQVRERYVSLTQKIGDRRMLPMELATAYGELGMVLQAAEYSDAAEPCYLNAQVLTPTEIRWPYYLGHLHRSRGEFGKAEASFQRVLELRPDDLATLIWLGRLYLDEGQGDRAESLFTRALSVSPRSVAVLAGLGRAALARHDYAGAVTRFEEALSTDPEAESLHAPLATAYRGLGDVDKATPHLRQWRNRDIAVPDPLQDELDMLLQSSLSYELRGIRALEVRNWALAGDYFRKGVELTRGNTPLRRSLQHKLGTALYMSGDVGGAREQFEAVVQAAPEQGIDESAAKAHYSLAVLLASSGDIGRAIEHCRAAVRYQPNYVEAHVMLANALMASGHVNASLPEYKEALDINPRSDASRLGYAMALARLGRSRDARAWLAEARRLYPDRPQYALALARLLATAPDDRLRNGQQAMAILEELFKTSKSTDLGETMAMAFAQIGNYERAAAVQRGVIDAARKAGLDDAARGMTENLRLYERRQPCRSAWRDDQAVWSPEVRVAQRLP